MAARRTTVARVALSVKLIPTQHRHKLFRRMVANKDKPALGLAAWAITLENDHQFKRYWNSGFHGMSIAGMSKLEHEILHAWCNHNGAIKVTRMRRFDDFMHPSSRDAVMNIPDDLPDITYMENEMIVIGSMKFIRAALNFTKRIPPRRHACYVQGIATADIRNELKQTNHRIIENLSDPGGYIVSCDDKERLFPLWIRG